MHTKFIQKYVLGLVSSDFSKPTIDIGSEQHLFWKSEIWNLKHKAFLQKQDVYLVFRDALYIHK